MADERVITEESTHLFHGRYLVNLPIRNPVKVFDETGYIIGAATLSFVDNAVQVELNIAKDTPEAFDLEVNQERVLVGLSGSVENDLDVSVTIKTR